MSLPLSMCFFIIFALAARLHADIALVYPWQDKPDGIAWIIRNHPEISDGAIGNLIGTTRTTIAAIRDRSHWNIANITPKDPVTLGLTTQRELDAAQAGHSSGWTERGLDAAQARRSPGWTELRLDGAKACLLYTSDAADE